MILYKNLLNNLIKLNFISNFFQILRPKFTILYYHGIKNDIDFDKLSGSSMLKKQIIEGVSEIEIRNSWRKGLEKFKKIRQKYLLY